MNLRVHVCGALGRMGSAAAAAIDSAGDLELVGTSGRGDDLAAALRDTCPEVVVEFTRPDAAAANLRTILAAGAHAVSGTTGLADEQLEDLGRQAAGAGVGLVHAANFALGAVLLQRFARQCAAWLDDVEIIELHHDAKLDAPSGTALETARQIGRAAGRDLNADRPRARELPGARGAPVAGVPIHSVRLPGLLAHQEVLFGAVGQTLTLRHDTFDRSAFMPGVLLAVRRVVRCTGLVRSLDSFLEPHED